MSEQPLQVNLEAIAHRPHQYILTFNSSQYSESVVLNPGASVLFTDWLRRLPGVLMGRNDSAGQLSSQELLRSVGTWLWQALFPGNVPEEERKTFTYELRTGLTPLLLTLPESLTWLPWELLCDPHQPLDQGFLACRRPLVRFHSSATPGSPIVLPIRVLLLISSPLDLKEDSRVDVESERTAVEQATRHAREAGFLHLLIEDIVTPKRVQQALVRFKPHIVHYIGHGEYNKETGGLLLWEDKQGKAFPLAAAAFASLLRPYKLSAVILHACETGRREARTDVLSVAETLMKEGIPAVLAQQASFSYGSSQCASQVWYTALTEGKGYAEALLKVRQALFSEHYPDWAVPIFYGGAASLAPVLEVPLVSGPPDPGLLNEGVAADLGVPTDVFVGRHSELQALRLMLENASGRGPRMALITGLGGSGKSILVAQAVTRYGGKYKAALRLSCLSYLSIDLFLQRLGEFLKQQNAPRFLEQTLPDPKLSMKVKIEEAVEALNQVGPMLLVLENLESAQHDDHTLRDESLLLLLQNLLAHLRGGRVFMTGRYEVKGLLPSEKSAGILLQLHLEDLSPYETKQLVMRHASLAKLGEVVREKIIHEFGGLPYVYNVLSRLAEGMDLDLLIHDMQKRITQEHKRRTAVIWREVHHQVAEFTALEAAVNHLSEPSGALFSRLSVFHQPFPLAAIEQGLGATQAEWQPLLDWSLLHYDQRTRAYHLHSLTRHFAEGLLEEQSRRQTQAQLAIWYEHYADYESHNLEDYLEAYRLYRAAGDFWHAGKLVLKLAVDLRQDGLFSLLRALCATTVYDLHDIDEILATQANQEIGVISLLQGHYEEAQGILQQNVNTFERLNDLLGKAAALGQLGTVAQQRSSYKEAKRLYRQSLTLYRQLGALHGEASILYQMGVLARLQGYREEARQFYQQSLDISERANDQTGKAGALEQLSILALDQHDDKEAQHFLYQALNISVSLNDLTLKSVILRSLGNIAQRQVNHQEAMSLFLQSLDLSENLGDLNNKALTLLHLGQIAETQKDYTTAYRFYQQSLGIHEALGDLAGQASSLKQLGRIAEEQGDYAAASRFYQQSLDISKNIGDLDEMATLYLLLGMSALKQNNHKGAHHFFHQALSIANRLQDLPRRAAASYQLGEIFQAQGNYSKARQFYQLSLDGFERLGNMQLKMAVLHHLGEIAQAQGNYEVARQLYQEIFDISERLNDPDGQAASLGQLGLLAYRHGNFEQALTLTIQAFLLFDTLDASKRVTALQVLSGIRSHVDEATFAACWKATAGERPQPDLSSTEDPYQSFLRIVMGFLQASTWEESQQFLKLHPELLKPDVDAVLEKLAMQQKHDDVRKTIEARRLLLAHCRDKGTNAVFTELQSTKRSEMTFADELNRLCNQVVITLQAGNVEQQEALAARLEQIQKDDLPMEGAADFLQFLIAWLHGQDTQALEKKLQPSFRAAYTRMLAVMEQEEAENTEEEDRLTVEQLPDVVSLATSQGTEEERQLLAARLIKNQQSPAILYQLGKIAQKQGAYEEAHGFYQQILDLFEQLGDQSGIAGSLLQLGMVAQDQGEYEEAYRLYQQSLDLFKQLGDQHGQADSLHNLGTILQKQGEYEEARRLYQQSLAIREQLGDQVGQAMALHNLGKIAQGQEKDEEARSLYQQSMTISEQLGDLRMQQRTLHQLGMIAQEQRKDEEARSLYRQSLAISEQLGDQRIQANSLGQLGHLASTQGRYEEAQDLYQQSLDLSEQLGDQREQVMTLRHLGMIAQDQGEYEEAYRLYQQSLMISEQLGDQRGQADSLGQLGNLAKDQGKYEEACGLYQQSLIISQRLGDRRGQAMTLENWGLIAQKQGKYEEAHSLYQQSLMIAELLGDQHRRAGTLHQLGRVAYLRGEYEEACRLCEQSLAISEQLGDQHGRANSLGQLGLLAYEQGNLEDALIYTIQAYIIFDALGSPYRTLAQKTMSDIRSRMNEETFITHWRTFAGDRPLIAALEQTKRQLTVEELPTVVSSLALKGTAEECQQFAAALVEVQQQLPPEALPLGRFLGCLAAALWGETPEMSLLEPPFTELWQEFQERLSTLPDTSSQQEEGNDG